MPEKNSTSTPSTLRILGKLTWLLPCLSVEHILMKAQTSSLSWSNASNSMQRRFNNCVRKFILLCSLYMWSQSIRNLSAWSRSTPTISHSITPSFKEPAAASIDDRAFIKISLPSSLSTRRRSEAFPRK